MINFIKGIFVGIFNIIPGLSGSALLIILNLYEKCLEAISNILKNPKKNILFLLPIGLGILLGTFLFSKVILYFINVFPSATFLIFTGFSLGTLPHLFKEASKKGFKDSYIIPFLITFSLGITMLLFDTKNITYHIDYNLISILKYFSIGILLSLSTIIPGLSSTVLLSLFNLYGIYLYSISNLNLIVLIPTAIGLIITSFFISKIINYFLKKHYGYTYFAILGFTISTIPSLLNLNFTKTSELITSIILGVIAFLITNYSFKVIK